MNPNRTYLYRSKAKIYTPAGRCALRLCVSAAVLGAMLLALAIWVASMHLQHAMALPLILAAAALVVWLAAFLILLPRSRRSKCAAPFIVCDADSARVWMLPTFSFTGDPAADAAAADALIDSEAFQQYPDLTQAGASFTATGWVLAGVDANGVPTTHVLGPRYRRIGDAALPAGSGLLVGNILCGVLLGFVLIASIVGIVLDRSIEYRQMNACVEQVTALVAQVYPEYALDIEFQQPHPGECRLHFDNPASHEDYLDAANFGRLDMMIVTDGESWQLEYASVSGWYLEGGDLSRAMELCRTLDPEFDTLSVQEMAANWEDLQAQFDAPSRTEEDVYATLTYSSPSGMNVFASISDRPSYMDDYYNFPEGLKGYYYFDYNHYRN